MLKRVITTLAVVFVGFLLVLLIKIDSTDQSLVSLNSRVDTATDDLEGLKFVIQGTNEPMVGASTLFAQNASVQLNLEVLGTASIGGNVFIGSSRSIIGAGTLTIGNNNNDVIVSTTNWDVDANGNVNFGKGSETSLTESYLVSGADPIFTYSSNLVDITGGASVSINFEADGYASASFYLGSAFTGVGDCNDSGEALGWTITGVFSCVSAGGGITFGTDNQIPFTNSGGTDFDYSANLTFDGSLLDLTGRASISQNLEVDGYASIGGNIFRPSGAVTNWNNGDVTLTHSSNLLTLNGGGLTVSGAILPISDGGSALGNGTQAFTNLYLDNTGTLNFNDGNVVLTHSTGTLTLNPGNLVVTQNASVSSNFEVGGYASASQFYFRSGTVSTPSIAKQGDIDTGIYSTGADVLDFTAGGNGQARVTTTQFLVLNNSQSAPGLSFINDANTGLWNPNTDVLGFTVGGTNTASLSLDLLRLSGSASVSANLELTGASSYLAIGNAGVRITNDNDGALTFLGLGNGSDEDLIMNLDDVSNTVTWSSTTGLGTWDIGAIGLDLDAASFLGLPLNKTYDGTGEIGGKTASATSGAFLRVHDGTAERVHQSRTCFGLDYGTPTSKDHISIWNAFDPFTVHSVYMTASGSNAVGWQIRHGKTVATLTDLFSANKQGSTTFDKLTTPYTSFSDATIADGERVDFVISSASATIDNIFVRICGYYDP